MYSTTELSSLNELSKRSAARGEKVFFGVVKRFGVEEPQLYYDIVPPSLTGKNSPLVYCTRLDTLPGAEDLVRQPLWKLFSVYQHLKRAGKLPPDNRGIKATGA